MFMIPFNCLLSEPVPDWFGMTKDTVSGPSVVQYGRIAGQPMLREGEKPLIQSYQVESAVVCCSRDYLKYA